MTEEDKEGDSAETYNAVAQSVPSGHAVASEVGEEPPPSSPREEDEPAEPTKAKAVATTGAPVAPIAVPTPDHLIDFMRSHLNCFIN